MKLQYVIGYLKDHEDRLTPDEQETLKEISARLVDLSSAKEAVSTDQRELVDELIRNVDDLAYAVYALAAAAESR